MSRCIAAQLGDLILEGTTKRRRHVGQPIVQSVGGLGDVTVHLDVGVEVRFLHINDVRRPVVVGDNSGARLCRSTHCVVYARAIPNVVATLDISKMPKEPRQWDSPSPISRMLIRTPS